MTQRFPFADDVDLQGRKLERVGDGTERTDGVNLGQLQDATARADYETTSNIPVRTTALTMTETYVFRVQNNTETDLGEATGLVINGSSIPEANRDISRDVVAGQFEFFSFTIPESVFNNLRNNPSNVELDIRFPVVGNIRVADEVASGLVINYWESNV